MQVLYSVLYPGGVGIVAAMSSAPLTMNSFRASWLHASALLITRARHLAFCLFSCSKVTESPAPLYLCRPPPACAACIPVANIPVTNAAATKTANIIRVVCGSHSV
jgi:hypothetical protein